MPKVALVGRQNVGKSTLFNAIIGKKKSIVWDSPGVTRDLISQEVSWQGFCFTLTDFPGFEQVNALDEITRLAVTKAFARLEEYHLLLWVVFRHGLSPYEENLASHLRKLGKPTWLVVNGLDDPQLENEAYNFYRLGFEKTFFVSALNRRGLKKLKDEIVAFFASGQSPRISDKAELSLAIVGKPNSGKSTYFNLLLRKELSLVSPIPGTTRDSHGEIYQFYGKKLLITDTAGLRKKNRVGDIIEKLSISQTLAAIRDADIVLLLVDATEGIDQQVKKIFHLLEKENKPVILVLNKQDLIGQEARNNLLKQVESLQELFWKFPYYFISALTGKNAVRPISEAFRLKERLELEITTSQLNRILEDLKKNPIIETQQVKVHYITKIAGKRHYILFGNKKSVSPAVYRYLLKELRKRTYGEEIPLILEIRDKIRD
ncbi:MAG: ribosome biogenesis GTPase Der [Leptospiraceae bacterium]|nr:ribosome biogenesis GTPase Der [Leptospiraceae bacterium]MDW8305946.1 ribosome biogenesis GTPase Der [Leptospiraceae bacterium]